MRKNILCRLKLVICFLFTVIFLISCDNKAKLNNNELISLVENVGSFKLKEFKPVMNQSENILIKNFNNEMIIFSTFYSPEIADKDNIPQYFYSTGKTVNIDSVKTMIASSDSKIEKDNILYTTDCVNIDNTAVNIIYKTDIEKQEISNLIEIKDMMPLSYLFDLDKNHILYYCVSSNGNNIYHYYINKLNLDSNEMETIIESEYDQNKMSGKIISCINTYDEKIYAYVLIDEKPFVEIYDVNGKLIKRIQLKFDENELTSGSVFTIGIIDNFVILSTINSNTIIFEINNDNCNRIYYDYYSLNPLSGSYNNYKSNNIYFAEAFATENLYVLDKNTKKLKKYIIEAENDNRRVQYYECDNDGNILVWTSDKDSYKDFNYYIIENSKIN